MHKCMHSSDSFQGHLHAGARTGVCTSDRPDVDVLILIPAFDEVLGRLPVDLLILIPAIDEVLGRLPVDLLILISAFDKVPGKLYVDS